MDPVVTEVVKHGLLSICEEMASLVCRSAHSVIVRESKDFSVALFDDTGRLIAESSGLPGHLLTMGLALKTFLVNEDLLPIEAGDVIVCNDPLIGPHHTPDVQLTSPIMHEGRVVGYAGVLAHHVDMGGKTAGSIAGDATEMFQEGLRLSPVKLYEKGMPNRALFGIIRDNVRLPDEVVADLQAQFAALNLAQRRFDQILVGQFSIDVVKQAIDHLIEYSEKRARQDIERIPDGAYQGEETVDDDGVSDAPVTIRVKVTVSGSSINVDFAGSSPQTRGPINAYLPTTICTVLYVVRTLLDEDIPHNEGVFAPISVSAPAGSIVNPRFPAPSGYHIVLHHRISDAVLGALAKAAPERVAAGSYGCTPTMALYGRETATSEPYVFIDILAGGVGARSEMDGIDGSTMHTSNSRNTPIEVAETRYPVLCRGYGYATDSGGAGRHRGGLGIVREWELLGEDALLSIASDRFKFPARGVHGGGEGAIASTDVRRADGTRIPLRSKATDIALRRGDSVRIQTAGGGGYGPPSRRDPADVLADVTSGRVSRGAAVETYGVPTGRDGPAVDGGEPTRSRAEATA